MTTDSSPAEVLARIPRAGVAGSPGVRFLLEGESAAVREHYPFAPTLGGIAAARIARGSPAAPCADMAGGSWVVATGHQACLFGGPLMILWKALTAVALARAASAHLGERVVPLFWAATEDHDLDEIRVGRVQGGEGQIHRFSHEFAGETTDTPAQDAILGDGVSALIDTVLSQLPASEHLAGLAADLRATYQPEATAGSAFVALMQRWLSPLGLVVVEPRQVAARFVEPLAREARDASAGELVRAAGRRLAALGLPAPLDPAPGPQLYGIAAGHRRRGAPAAGEQPSAAASMRPVWQDAAFPVLAYVGGPGEVSYYGQLRCLHEHHSAPFPVVWPRASGTLLEPVDRRICAALGIAAADLLDSDLEERPAGRDTVPAAVRQELAQLKESARASFARLVVELETVPGLASPLARTEGSVTTNLQKLAGKIESHFDGLGGIDAGRRQRLAHTVRPGGELQERRLSTISLVARHGPVLFEALLAAIDPLRFEHLVLGL